MHQFNSRLASMYGIEEAILIHNFYYWIKKNAANEQNFRDGRYWTYNTTKAFQELFPYINETKIHRVIKHLVEEDIILKEKYNSGKFDRTCWYSFSDSACKILKDVGYDNLDFVKMKNGSSQNEMTIPNSKHTNDLKEYKEDKSSFKKDADCLKDSPTEENQKRHKKQKEDIIWRTDFSAYLSIVDETLDALLKDEDRKKNMLQLYPSADYERTVMKWYQYWGSEKGWDCKKKSTSKKINMLLTFDRNYDKSIVNKSYGVQSPPPRKNVTQDGVLPDGTYVLGGYRYYDSPKYGQRVSIDMDAPIRPNEVSEYDYKSNNWFVPSEHDNGIFFG